MRQFCASTLPASDFSLVTYDLARAQTSLSGRSEGFLCSLEQDAMPQELSPRFSTLEWGIQTGNTISLHSWTLQLRKAQNSRIIGCREDATSSLLFPQNILYRPCSEGGTAQRGPSLTWYSQIAQRSLIAGRDSGTPGAPATLLSLSAKETHWDSESLGCWTLPGATLC